MTNVGKEDFIFGNQNKMWFPIIPTPRLEVQHDRLFGKLWFMKIYMCFLSIRKQKLQIRCETLVSRHLIM